MARSRMETSTGMEILANILRHCDYKTNRNILTGLEREIPQVAAELRKKIISYDDLAYADVRGIQTLLKIVRTRDLAMSLKGATQDVLKNIASNLSARALNDLKEEITLIGPVREAEVETARERVMTVATELIKNKEMFINRPTDDLVY